MCVIWVSLDTNELAGVFMPLVPFRNSQCWTRLCLILCFPATNPPVVTGISVKNLLKATWKRLTHPAN